MLRSKAFVRRTKRGNILKVVKEHYLRDDLFCGSGVCNECGHEDPLLSGDGCNYLVIDTNIALHQIDLLENPTLTDVIILQTVLEEVKHRSFQIYNRLRNITKDRSRRFYVFSNEHHRQTYIDRRPDESPNDRNDRAIRVSAKWYQTHLGGNGISVTLLTDDAGNRSKAKEDGLDCKSLREYVEGLKDHPELVDLLAEAAADDSVEFHGKGQAFFPAHLPQNELAQRIREGKLYQGPLRCSRDNCMEAYVNSDLGEDILIRGAENLNRAVDSDIVAVELLPKENWISPATRIVEGTDDAEIEADDLEVKDMEPTEIDRSVVRPTGKVVGIITRKWRQYCGSLQVDKDKSMQHLSDHYLFIPVKKNIPRIRIKTRQGVSLMSKRFVVAIDAWERTSRFPTGHFVRTLGEIGSKEAENEVLLLEHEVRCQPFSKNVLACLPPEGPDYTISDDELARREDLRSVNVCSIDPPGCTDIDDALHCTALPDGNFEVGVHIADVTHFVKTGTAIDEEAATRGTTVYLVDQRIDMLPELLGTNLCSLRSNVDRQAFSCIWVLDSNARIVSVRFAKTVIRSRHSFTYEEAQNRMDDNRNNDETTQQLRQLNSLAKSLRKARIDAGALSLASPEVKFNLDHETQDPLEVGVYQLREANALVEEFMLLANCSVAAEIYKHFPQCAMLRRHPAPVPSMFEPLLNAVETVGVALDTDSSKALADSLDRAHLKENPYFNKLIRILATRSMQQAVYFSSGTQTYDQFHHYGLAAPIYTHFTSPIRRYADVIVHRLLAACIAVENLSISLHNKAKIEQIALNINMRHKMAQYASRASTELHTLLFFRNKKVVEDAYITRVRANGFSVLVPKYGVEGTVYVCGPKDPNPFRFDDKKQCLTSGWATFKIFQKISVELYVEKSEQHREKLCVVPIKPSLDASKESTSKGTPSKKAKIEGDFVPLSSNEKPGESEEPAVQDKEEGVKSGEANDFDSFLDGVAPKRKRDDGENNATSPSAKGKKKKKKKK